MVHPGPEFQRRLQVQAPGLESSLGSGGGKARGLCFGFMSPGRFTSFLLTTTLGPGKLGGSTGPDGIPPVLPRYRRELFCSGDETDEKHPELRTSPDVARFAWRPSAPKGCGNAAEALVTVAAETSPWGVRNNTKAPRARWLWVPAQIYS